MMGVLSVVLCCVRCAALRCAVLRGVVQAVLCTVLSSV